MTTEGDEIYAWPDDDISYCISIFEKNERKEISISLREQTQEVVFIKQ